MPGINLGKCATIGCNRRALGFDITGLEICEKCAALILYAEVYTRYAPRNNK